jgi:DNA-binding protein HU-beta
MNKMQLVENVAKASKLQKSICKKAIEFLMDTISKALKAGKTVSLTGFGTFTVMKRKARKGVNPATGKPMEIKAKKVPKFKPGKALRDMVA